MALTSNPTWRFRLQPRKWLALARLVRDNPGDVTIGARVFFSIGGHDEEPTYLRFLHTSAGAHLVQNAIALPPLFTDYERLRELPIGTLGREYVRELDERDIHPIELAELTHAAYEGKAFSPEHAYVRDRVRDSHDLFHTLTGYETDVIGETAVLAFTFGQTGNKGWAILVLLSHLAAGRVGRFNGWLVAWKGFLRGRRARYLPAVDDWDRLFRLPIDAARAELGISTPESYRTLTFEDALENFAKDSS